MTIKKELVFRGITPKGYENMTCLINFFYKTTGKLAYQECLRCSFDDLQGLVSKHFGHKNILDFWYTNDLSEEQFKDFQPYLTHVPDFTKLDVDIRLATTTDPVTEYVPILEDDQEKGG